MNNNKGQKSAEAPEADREPHFSAQEEAGEAAGQYAKRKATAERNLGDGVKRLLSARTLTKAAILEGLDLFPVFAGYSGADLYAAVDGALDISFGILHHELDAQERLTSGLRGAAKVTVAALPFAPAAGITPALDALIPTARDERKP